MCAEVYEVKMKKTYSIIFASLLLLFLAIPAMAQDNTFYDDGFSVTDNTFNPNRALDSLKTKHVKVPKGLYLWTIDDHFGDRTTAAPDTAQHLFMNSIFTTGRYGEYNTTGNLGAPRIARIATDRDYTSFGFTDVLSYFITPPTALRFTNTLSPITNLSFNSCGDRTNGEDHLKALFAANINREAGFGFKFDYAYGRGYYQNQSTALFDYTMWGSYIGQRYNAHVIFSFDHLKVTENGGITNDEYITHPEATSETYSENEIPVVLSSNWNRTNAFHATLAHRYNVGFYRKVPMTEQEIEARRFAIKAQKEKEAAEAAAEAEKMLAGATGNTGAPKQSKRLSGRPDDAMIVGDLNNDSLRTALKKAAEERRKLLMDSLMAKKDSVAIDTSWTKEEYVPVTSFIHNLQFDDNWHTYIAYQSPTNFYQNKYSVPVDFARKDSINDKTDYFNLRNTFAIGLLEGFNKYVPMGAKVFIAHNIANYRLAEDSLTRYSNNVENTFSVGGQLIKTLGNTLHYKVLGEVWLAGKQVGDVKIDGEGDIRVPILKDSVVLNLKAFYHLTTPAYFQRHYHSKHFWWDHDGLNKQMHTHVEGSLAYTKTRTSLRFAYDNFQNLVYLGVSYDRNNSVITGYTADIMQSSKNISLLTLAIQQDFTLGILNWENRITFQKCSDNNVLPVPDFNFWTNLYLKFKIARVLAVHFGADMRYFKSYYAPEYVPQLSQFAVQQNDNVKTKIGNYPVIDVYANFLLKRCRFFVMMSHVNSGTGNYFFTPHYPLNQRVFRLGLSWTVFN